MSTIPVHLYTCVDPSTAGEYAVDGTKITGRPFPLGRNAEAAANRLFGVYTRRLSKLSESVIHVHDVYLSGVARRRTNVAVFVADLAKRTTRNYPRPSSWLHNLMLPNLRRAAVAIALSEFVRAEIITTVGLPPEQVVVAYPTADLAPAALVPGEYPSPTPDRPWNLLYVAVDRPHKNVEMFLRTLAGLDDRFRGVFVGVPRPETLRLARDLGVEQRWSVQGGVSDLRSVFREATVYLHPSRYEGFGFPLLQAFSQGIPVIASRAAAIPEVVGDGGALVPPGDSRSWVESVLRLVDERSYLDARRASMGRGKFFTPERTSASLRRAYLAAAGAS